MIKNKINLHLSAFLCSFQWMTEETNAVFKIRQNNIFFVEIWLIIFYNVIRLKSIKEYNLKKLLLEMVIFRI